MAASASGSRRAERQAKWTVAVVHPTRSDRDEYRAAQGSVRHWKNEIK
jgi:hypothetical protein